MLRTGDGSENNVSHAPGTGMLDPCLESHCRSEREVDPKSARVLVLRGRGLRVNRGAVALS